MRGDAKTGVTYRGAPQVAIDHMFGGACDVDGQTALKLRGYGGGVAVSCCDGVFAPRLVSRASPQVIVGKWTNLAALTLGTGVCLYKTYDVEAKEAVRVRMYSGLHDRMMRARYLRKAVECWKRDTALRDEIAFPGHHRAIKNYWHSFIEPTNGSVGLKALMEG